MWRNEHLILLFLFAFSLFSACKSISTSSFENVKWVDTPDHGITPSELIYDNLSYQDYVRDRLINIKFHIVNSLDSSANFRPHEADIFIGQLLDAANHRLKYNDPMSLPEGNNTPLFDTHLRYQLVEEGIVYHYDADCYFIKNGYKSNRFDVDKVTRWTQGQDSMIHIFLMPFDPNEIKSGRQKRENTGIALGNAIKIAGYFESGGPGWNHAGVFNHEVGHVLGLMHTWNEDDACPDTPMNDNCWVQSDAPPCDGPTSNNLMDYNAHQSAITPCQIIRMHQKIDDPTSIASKVVQPPEAIHFNAKSVLKIHRDHIWKDLVYLDRDVVVNSGITLFVDARVVLIPPAKIILKKKSRIVWVSGDVQFYSGESYNFIEAHRSAKFIKKRKELY